MFEFIAVGFGGFIGACLRYLITKLIPVMQFPVATLISNVLAGILIGVIIGLDRQLGIPSKAKLFLATGIMGGLSTFSAFSIETVCLFENGKYILASGNILLNVCLSLMGVFIGLLSVRLLFGIIK